MGIHEDIQQGKLTKATLAQYLGDNPNILNELDSATGYPPLATAVTAGFSSEVEQLLTNGAKADALTRDGETALLLITRPKTFRNRPRIVQLLLDGMSADSVDATTAAHGNNTPLMFAVLNEDHESIRLLAKAGASLTVKNENGLTAKEMADRAADKTIALSLDPKKERAAFARLTSLVVSLLLYIVAWVNKAINGVARRLFELNPELNEAGIDKKINRDGTPETTEFVENVEAFVKGNPTLERFFKGNPSYIQDLAEKATALKADQTTPLGSQDLLPKTIKVTLHQQVIYCDDSSSMKRDGRWAAQATLVNKIAQITTRILPEGDGVALRFINQDVNDSSENLSLEQIGKIMTGMSWKKGGETEIGTCLKSKILDPLVYRKLQAKTLARPLLISVITDGMPSVENKGALVEAIKECGEKLQQAEYPRNSVKFMIGQIGTSEKAAKFLEGVGKDTNIADMVFVTTDQLDEKLSSFKENEGNLDRWLIETLFSPIMQTE
ncbi:unnamed protein product [Peniophora sp. CBMAI 1063]|nr:unnamed protein product [Peniophora sp. CBMAI 1063]